MVIFHSYVSLPEALVDSGLFGLEFARLPLEITTSNPIKHCQSVNAASNFLSSCTGRCTTHNWQNVGPHLTWFGPCRYIGSYHRSNTSIGSNITLFAGSLDAVSISIQIWIIPQESCHHCSCNRLPILPACSSLKEGGQRRAQMPIDPAFESLGSWRSNANPWLINPQTV